MFFTEPLMPIKNFYFNIVGCLVCHFMLQMGATRAPFQATTCCTGDDFYPTFHPKCRTIEGGIWDGPMC